MDGVEGRAPARVHDRRAAVAARGPRPRRVEPRHVLVALEGGAAVVAHPVVVDLDVEARLVALDVAAPVLHGDVAAHLAAGAERRLLVEVPDALGEAEAGRGQGAHRADVHHAGGERVGQLLARERADLDARAAVEEAELAGARDLLGEADAARALDAAVHVEDDVGAERDALAARVGPLVLVLEARVGDAVLEGVVLQAALAGLVADRAVERVVDEEELHHPLLRLVDLGHVGAHHHAVLHHLGGAGRSAASASPSILTRHMRHWPTTDRRGW